MKERTLALLALHGHFVVADAVKQLIQADAPVDEETARRLGDDLVGVAQVESRLLRLQVFYALMYVVVEGYIELRCQDSSVDGLLEQSDFVDAFKRFRNGTFPFQRELVSPKVQKFLDANGSEEWALDLYWAMKAFLEKQLPINQFFNLPRGG
jgi:hypothetical protein